MPWVGGIIAGNGVGQAWGIERHHSIARYILDSYPGLTNFRIWLSSEPVASDGCVSLSALDDQIPPWIRVHMQEVTL